MKIREGIIVELYGSQYYVLEASGGAFSETINGDVVFCYPPTTIVLKRVVSNGQQ